MEEIDSYLYELALLLDGKTYISFDVVFALLLELIVFIPESLDEEFAFLYLFFILFSLFEAGRVNQIIL